jgi:hypothetical protein
MIGGLPSLDGNTLDPEYFKMHEWDGTSWKTIEAQNPATKRGWDGSKWPPINASNGVRREMIVVYDQARKRVVLFGGADTKYTTSFDDTWEYDPAVQGWAEVNVVPKALNDRPIAAYDEARQRSVVLTNKARETWLWDGTSWAHALPRTTEHPEAEGSAAAYDAVRKQVVTFGGSVNGVASDETWLWDGGDWKKAEGLAPPQGQPRDGLGPGAAGDRHGQRQHDQRRPRRDHLGVGRLEVAPDRVREPIPAQQCGPGCV